MFKGGFASHTKTGRSIAIGRRVGESLARGSNGSSRTCESSSEEPSCFFAFTFLLMCALLLQAITKALKDNQIQPQ